MTPTEVVKRLTERWGGDRSAVEKLVHPDVEIDMEFSEPVAQRYVVEDGLITRMTLLTDIERAVRDFEAGRPPHPPAE